MKKVLLICALMLCPMIVWAQDDATVQKTEGQGQQRISQRGSQGLLGRLQARVAQKRMATPVNNARINVVPKVAATEEEQNVIDVLDKLGAESRQSQRGPVVEFINRQQNSITIALAGWDSAYYERQGSSSSLAVVAEPYEWVQGWYTIEPGETKRFNRGQEDFYYTLPNWKKGKQEGKEHYFWAPDSRFYSTRKRDRNVIELQVTISGAKYDPWDFAPVPHTIQWGPKTGNRDYANYANPKNEQSLRDNNWAPYLFFAVPKDIKSVIFSNGKAEFRR